MHFLDFLWLSQHLYASRPLESVITILLDFINWIIMDSWHCANIKC